ncbi:mycothiol synthase [Plantactinospora sp. S1510]|uniref:Mycothiol acetyltransferase n=1 Tax=Plantactinospora alkalitolerans TaxID=2789879 RepID=A0ABS0H6C9_9ACTN|nr:mycothiol synthase [Plantactinospora alkalitolerans]MBF9133978.1 mycothiol synthase [Plantactinospora alkalitolerans]
MTRARTTDHRVTRLERPSPDDVEAVLALATVAGAADGTESLSEDAALRLRNAEPGTVTHLTLRQSDGLLFGYAQLEFRNDGGGVGAELVVHPMHRRQGLGRLLVEATVAEAAGDARPATSGGTSTGAGDLLVWAHSDHPSAAALALDLGFDRARVLWQLRRSLRDPLPEPELPDGVSIRAFRPGEDDEAWLAVNRRAFADHPEQGRWTLADLRLRLAEPWFDRNGFLLAVEDSTGRIVGFHWTKVHGAVGRSPAIGEVYVLGVDPTAHRGGLGRALSLAGLHHLRNQGLTRVMLYVDESNERAMALYIRLGFANWLRHVQYRRPATAAE